MADHPRTIKLGDASVKAAQEKLQPLVAFSGPQVNVNQVDSID